MPASQPCRVCGGTTGNQLFTVKEMLHGTREQFEYLECGTCGCLQLADMPEDLSQFYPEDYCCYKDYRKRANNGLRRALDSWLVGQSLPRETLSAKLAGLVHPGLDYLAWTRFAGVDRDSRILDIGCGSGKLLIRMSLGGFKVLDGVDPFISGDIVAGDSVHIRKIGVQEYIDSDPEKYDLVMLHHAFEHVPDPVETLQQAGQLMGPGGHLLIRIPVADCHSRDHYRENWFSWDPPRHTYLHTKESMKYLAEKTGFVIRKVEHDATFHQLRASELYKQGVPGNEHSSVLDRFSRSQIRQFKALTAKLNAEQRGEQAAFFLQKQEDCGENQMNRAA